MNHWERYRKILELRAIQLAGLDFQQEILRDLDRTISTRNAWAAIAVLAQATILPLNVIVNAFPGAGNASSLFKRIGVGLYERYGASGTRTQSGAGKLLNILKGAVTAEVQRRGKAGALPPVRVLFGLAEDSMALMETMELTASGNTEGKDLRITIQNRIASIRQKLLILNEQQNALLQAMERQGRTA